MAYTVPDLATLSTWEDAFQYPLPVVHRLEQQLRASVEGTRTRLRALVGASYRDLLGTAENIVVMNEQMQTVESQLTTLGTRCNPRVLERIISNHARMREVQDARSTSRHATIAQTKVLQSALGVVGRIIKAGGDALLAAKLLILARLLHKSVAESANPPEVLEELRRRLRMLRKKILAYTERVISRPSSDRTIVSHALGAHALVTNSTPKEALRDFLQIRYDLIASKDENPSEADVFQMLEVYGQTLLDAHNLFPRRFSEVLDQLRRTPLLEDDQVRSVQELNLEVLESWISTNVRAFTPWVRHDQIAPGEVADAVSSWSRQSQECLLRGLEENLKGQFDIGNVVTMRQKVISKYQYLKNNSQDESNETTLSALRIVFLDGLKKLVSNTAQTFDISFKHEGDADGLRPKHNLWNLATSDLVFANGAKDFRKAVIWMHHGRGEISERQFQRLDQYIDWTTEFLLGIEVMRSNRWDDDLELDMGDSEEHLLELLTKNDPRELEDVLHQTTKTVLRKIYGRIQQASADGVDAAFLVRSFREVDYRVASLSEKLKVPLTSVRGDEVATDLHNRIVHDVMRSVVPGFLHEFKTLPAISTALFDGAPPLPVQPSPVTFKFLTSLQRTMVDLGQDIWSDSCVRQLKDLLLEKLARELKNSGFDVAETAPVISGNRNFGAKPAESELAMDETQAAPEGDEASSHDTFDARSCQRYFDMLYLQRALGIHHSAGGQSSHLVDLLSHLKTQSRLDAVAGGLVDKNASEFWTRTYLLFGLLSSDAA